MDFPFQRRRQIREFLMAYADALVAGQIDVNALLRHRDPIVVEEVEHFLDLADRINTTLTGVTPSDQFVARLRLALLETAGDDAPGLWRRMRQLPPRTQLAAGLGGATLTAGVVLFATRRPLLDMIDHWLSRRAATA